jgi:hypothetical protein
MRQEDPGYRKSRIKVSPALMTFQLPKKQTTPRGLKQEPQNKLSGDFTIHKHEKMFAGGEGKKKYPERQCKACATIRSKVKLETFVNSALFHITKGLLLRNTIQ